jgi:hypothetical protein
MGKLKSQRVPNKFEKYPVMPNFYYFIIIYIAKDKGLRWSFLDKFRFLGCSNILASGDCSSPLLETNGR